MGDNYRASYVAESHCFKPAFIDLLFISAFIACFTSVYRCCNTWTEI